jgi:nucleoside-diphosphate-sugar epimerase
VAAYAKNQSVTEDAQLERYPQCRGAYSSAKLQAEILVRAAMSRDEFAVVILRPGTIYGSGAQMFTSMMGVSIRQRIFVVFGDGYSQLPLVYVDNLVDAIMECIKNNAADNQIFNVVDQDIVTKKRYMELVIKRLFPHALVIYVPIPLLLVATWCQEKLVSMFGGRPLLTVYRLLASQKPIRYSTSKIEKAIGWHSRVGFEKGIENVLRKQVRSGNTTP